MIVSNDLIIKSLIQVFQICVWLWKGLIIKTKSSITKSINTPPKSLIGILENNRPSEVHHDIALTRVIVVSPTTHLLWFIHLSRSPLFIMVTLTSFLSIGYLCVDMYYWYMCLCMYTHEEQPYFSIFINIFLYEKEDSYFSFLQQEFRRFRLQHSVLKEYSSIFPLGFLPSPFYVLILCVHICFYVSEAISHVVHKKL